MPQATEVGATGQSAAPSPGSSGAKTQTGALRDRHYHLDNVCIEEGFAYDGEVVVGTRTGLYRLEIEDGRIKSLQSATAMPDMALPAYDAQGGLLLPTFRDMHIHLDKTFYGGPWQAPLPRRGTTIMTMIEREEALIPQLLPTSQQRAEGLIALLLSKGSTFARSHCNIDPVSGLKSLEHLQRALDNHRESFECEIVAFPQHGLLHSKVDGLMREALAMGAHYVGGLDPTNVDGAMEQSLDAMFQIALDNDKGVDIHIHEGNPAGLAAIDYMLDTIENTPALRGRVTLSHAFALATISADRLDGLADRMAACGIGVASSVPIGRLTMPLPQLRAKGIAVMTGTDSVIDHWSPFGTGDMLHKANLYAQLYDGGDEFHLSRAIAVATGGILPLNDDGRRAWPKAGDKADFVLVDASCSAEAVARCPPRSATFHKGRLVYGKVGRA